MSHFYLGLDASKGYADFALLDEAKQLVEPTFQLDDTCEGHRTLLQYLQTFFTQHPEAELFVAVESTGGYENNWYERLKVLGQILPLRVARLNPAAVKANAEAGMCRNRTDALSAREVAGYLIAHPEKVRYNENSYPLLRRRWKFIRLLSKQKTQLLNQLDSLLYITMPELLSLCRNGYPQWLLQLLKTYPTYQQLQAAGVIGLAKLPYLSPRKAERVIALVQHGIGKRDPLSGSMIMPLAEQILQLETQIARQKELLAQNYHEAQAEIDLLCSFKGIGVFSAVGLLLNIVDIGRFPHVKKLVSYFGLHPVLKQSGDGVWRVRMSKKGRAEPRAILFMVTFSAMRFNPAIQATYARALKHGLTKMAAMGVCMHKIIRIVYGMLKHRTPFDPSVDAAYQARTHAHSTSEKPQTDKRRRLQAFDENAPISARQHYKRTALRQAHESQREAASKTTPAQSTSRSRQTPAVASK